MSRDVTKYVIDCDGCLMIVVSFHFEYFPNTDLQTGNIINTSNKEFYPEYALTMTGVSRIHKI
jgi:hypothetical protein